MKNTIAIVIAVIFGATGIALLNMEPRNAQTIESGSEAQSKPIKLEPSNPVTTSVSPENANASIQTEGIKPEGPIDLSKITNDPKEIAIIEEYMTDIDLQDSVRTYFDSYENLSAEERQQLAQKIEAQLDRQEAEEKIIPLEALSLRLALLKTNSSDADYPELARQLTEKYQASIAATEPEFDTIRADRYKEEERKILREVQAMSQYPNGMSQSQYLRQRLNEAREEIYTDEVN